jgi:membrane AbrB-like protein
MVLLRSLAAALVGAVVLDRLKFPAGPLIGAMIGVAVVGLSGHQTQGSGGVLRFAALAIIGWELGAQVDRSTLNAIRQAALPIVVVVLGLLAASAVLAMVLHRSGLDAPTSFLAASPGGLSQMVALSVEFGANAVVVSVVHLIRILTVILSAPLIARFLDG